MVYDIFFYTCILLMVGAFLNKNINKIEKAFALLINGYYDTVLIITYQLISIIDG